MLFVGLEAVLLEGCPPLEVPVGEDVLEASVVRELPEELVFAATRFWGSKV